MLRPILLSICCHQIWIGSQMNDWPTNLIDFPFWEHFKGHIRIFGNESAQSFNYFCHISKIDSFRHFDTISAAYWTHASRKLFFTFTSFIHVLNIRQISNAFLVYTMATPYWKSLAYENTDSMLLNCKAIYSSIWYYIYYY